MAQAQQHNNREREEGPPVYQNDHYLQNKQNAVEVREDNNIFI